METLWCISNHPELGNHSQVLRGSINITMKIYILWKMFSSSNWNIIDKVVLKTKECHPHPHTQLKLDQDTFLFLSSLSPTPPLSLIVLCSWHYDKCKPGLYFDNKMENTRVVTYDTLEREDRERIEIGEREERERREMLSLYKECHCNFTFNLKMP